MIIYLTLDTDKTIYYYCCEDALCLFYESEKPNIKPIKNEIINKIISIFIFIDDDYVEYLFIADLGYEFTYFFTYWILITFCYLCTYLLTVLLKSFEF